ncbi:catalase, partial [Bacillus sp. WP8]|uniref:catalase n=1 Tax=Bacillus sp. WP8 TaxID=756828 RepID=UPI0011A71637
FVHPRAPPPHPYFQPYRTFPHQPISTYPRPKFFHNKQKNTPLFLPFSSLIHPPHSPQTLPHPTPFPIKFYTEQPNSHLLPNNLKIFFIPHPLKFPHFLHPFKPHPLTNPHHRHPIFHFLSQSPQPTHMVTFLFS